MSVNAIYALAKELGEILQRRKLHCAVAESCTGGGLAAAITDIPGSSQWFDRGFVTYTNEAKEEVLGVPAHIIEKHGAVSEATVRAMAQGVIITSNAEVSVAISGIAGPGGGSLEKPVGTVWIAWAGNLQVTQARCFVFKGDRTAIRQQAIQSALEGLIQYCQIEKQPTDSSRYFFAIWPNEKIAQAIYQCGQELRKLHYGQTVAVEKLHMTLVYLGSVPVELVEAAKQVANQIQVFPFKMRITQVNYWPRIHLRWLGLEQTPANLEQLVAALEEGLVTIGFKPEKRNFTPHITIARKCTHRYKSASIDPLIWNVEDFCLVKSIKIKGGSTYEIIQRWRL